MIMKKLKVFFLYILVSFLLSLILTYLMSITNLPMNIGIIYFVLCYILTIIGLCYFIKIRPFNQWLFPIVFIVPLLSVYIYESLHCATWFNYLMTIFIFFFYTIPGIFISLIIAMILSIIDKRRTG